MLGRIEIQTDNSLQLFSEPRVLADLECFDQVGLQTMRAPNAQHGRVADAHLLGHAAGRPMSGVSRLALRGLLNDLLNQLRRDRRRTSGSWRIFLNSLKPSVEKALPPT